jgi:hypothetical protein
MILRGRTKNSGRFRGFKNDHKGSAAAIIAIVVALIVAALVVLVVFFPTVLGQGPGWYDPGKGNDNANPIFGYLDISVQLSFDNGPLHGNGVIYGMVPNTLAAAVSGAAPQSQSILQKFLDIFSAHDAAYTVEFKVLSPALNYNAPINKVTGVQNVGAGQVITPTVHNSEAFALRDHGMYSITATLYDGGGKLISASTINAAL